MGQPAILVENIFSTVQFGAHTVVADEQAPGFEVYHVANGRRAPNDRYQSSIANQARILTATCDRVRWCNGLALDRGHNLAGFAISLLGSSDSWATSRTVWTGTIPSAPSFSASLDNTNGVVTERELAFLVRYLGDAFLAWRISIPALGSGVVAQVVGLWVGMWKTLPFLNKPVSDDAANLMGLEQQSSAGWVGESSQVPRREGTIHVQTTSPWDEESLRLHLDGHYLDARRPMWYVRDDAQAERGMLVIRPKTVAGLGYESGWGWLQGHFPFQEHEPVRPGG